MNRLLLIRHATTAATRRAVFPASTGAAAVAGCEPLDRAGLAQAHALGPHLPAADQLWSSFAVRALQTAEALALGTPSRHADLAEADFGRWAGRAPAAVHAEDPDALAAWYADPSAVPPGSEPLARVRQRARRVLRTAAAGGTTVAVTHGGLIKAVLLEVLELPDAAVWRIDAAPCSVTELHPAGGGWRVVHLNWTPQLTMAAA